MNTTEKHLKNITPELLTEFKNEDAFSEFASSFGRTGAYQLGVDGHGNYVVRTKLESFKYTIPEEAIEKYKQLLTEKE